MLIINWIKNICIFGR